MDNKNYTDIYKKAEAERSKRRLTDDDYNGVIYEPSRQRRPPTRAPRPHASTTRPPASKPVQSTKKKRNSHQSQFAAFYIVTLFTGVIICIVIFAVIFNTLSQKIGNAKIPGTGIALATPVPTSELTIKEISQITALVRDVDATQRLLNVMDISNNTQYTLKADAGTELMDKYGNSVALIEFKTGSIIDASFDARSCVLTNLTISAQAWEYRSRKDIRINTENNTIAFGNNTYIYDDTLIVIYNNQPYDISMISDIDILTIAGFKDRIWYVLLEKGHGSMDVVNYDHIKNGTLEIDTSAYMALTDIESLKLTEGLHRIVVKGSNIDPFVSEINVTAGGLIELDLSEVDFKSGMLNIKVNEDGYQLFIDGVLIPGREALELSYGEYTMRVEKADYLSYENVVNINSPEKEVNVELKKEVKKGTIVVNTDPVTAASVYVDNVLIGTSPAQTVVEYGSHTVTVRKDGYISMDPYTVELEIPELILNYTLIRSDNIMPTSVPAPPMPTN